jgi:hypothetical protein
MCRYAFTIRAVKEVLIQVQFRGVELGISEGSETDRLYNARFLQDYVESKLPGSGPVEYTVNIRVNDIKPSSKTEDASLPRTFLWDIDDLVSLRDRYREGKSTEDFNKTLAWLRRDLKPSLDRGVCNVSCCGNENAGRALAFGFTFAVVDVRFVE